MGQTLSRKPISQRSGFATLNTASNPFSQQPQQPQQSPAPAMQIGSPSLQVPMGDPTGAGVGGQSGAINPPATLGFKRFGISGIGPQATFKGASSEDY